MEWTEFLKKKKYIIGAGFRMTTTRNITYSGFIKSVKKRGKFVIFKVIQKSSLDEDTRKEKKSSIIAMCKFLIEECKPNCRGKGIQIIMPYVGMFCIYPKNLI